MEEHKRHGGARPDVDGPGPHRIEGRRDERLVPEVHEVRPESEVHEAHERRPAGGDAERPPGRPRPRAKAQAEDEDQGGHEHEPVEAEEDDELPAREVPGQLGGQHREERARAGPEVDDLGRGPPRRDERDHGQDHRRVAQLEGQQGPPGQPALARGDRELEGHEHHDPRGEGPPHGRPEPGPGPHQGDERQREERDAGEGAHVRGAERDEGRRGAQNRNRTPIDGRNGMAAVGSRTSRGWSRAEPGS